MRIPLATNPDESQAQWSMAVDDTMALFSAKLLMRRLFLPLPPSVENRAFGIPVPMDVASTKVPLQFVSASSYFRNE